MHNYVRSTTIEWIPVEVGVSVTLLVMLDPCSEVVIDDCVELEGADTRNDDDDFGFAAKYTILL